mmetsp:Transcript_7725/g.19147  ORF Transcript_7725/g.19147 Transcript_7725/m.19147 type:complete len:87 (-) Transcript_7725:196-456(-)
MGIVQIVAIKIHPSQPPPKPQPAIHVTDGLFTSLWLRRIERTASLGSTIPNILKTKTKKRCIVVLSIGYHVDSTYDNPTELCFATG